MAGLKELTDLSRLQLAGLLVVTVVTIPPSVTLQDRLGPVSLGCIPIASSRETKIWNSFGYTVNMDTLFVWLTMRSASVIPDAIRKILGATLHKDKWYKIIAFPDGRFENPMSATDPRVKMELSKHLAPAYTLSNLLVNERNISETIELLLGWLNKFASSGDPIDLGKYFTLAPSDIVGDAVFSKQFGFLREGLDINNSIANVSPNPVITWLNITPWGHLIDTAMSAIKERQKNQDARVDAVAHWFRMLHQHPNRMQLHEIHSAAFNAVAAGNETVASGLQAFVYYVIRHPNAWGRTRAEIETAGLEGPVIGYMDAQKLPFLQACIKETLRVFGPAPIVLPRIVPEGVLTIGDRTIPQGTIVSMNIWGMHYLWAPSAGEFNLDRWLGEDAAHLSKYYIPWGMGYASCPRQNLARIELYKICATLVQD
ncbi:benzoate 4-monooxygenase cytochrome P450 [Blastomyces gilchristii SLH14081]|uniref:Benzoate 4-monooxygenase cytochrome P450 n=1 Tax=Blastomyces gilchristii (strain SLH14081) TaxID=559298 RepID=A0A179UUV3_BLAGS|nr:benzoate 4-monooxygenase cytochrome P450 [Blastomyces gilchristii SLH14081]OAT11573.1 benzoate 4-monooxygenase cytochrome P450 [Blastomyces gilchristii SLH14081]